MPLLERFHSVHYLLQVHLELSVIAVVRLSMEWSSIVVGVVLTLGSSARWRGVIRVAVTNHCSVLGWVLVSREARGGCV
eukprot:129415-Alexandrium_andersonii.AAC.1